jgi:hypothetical protein
VPETWVTLFALAGGVDAVDALDGTGFDIVIHLQEDAEGMADTIAAELQSRWEGDLEELKERNSALLLYAARLSGD